MDFNDLFRIIRRRSCAFLGCFLLAFLAISFGNRFVRPSFRSEIKLLCLTPSPGGGESLKALGLLESVNPANLIPLLNSAELGNRIHQALRKAGDADPPSGPAIAARLELKKVDGTSYERLAITDDSSPRSARILNLLVEEANRLWAEKVQASASEAQGLLAAWRSDVDAGVAALRGDLDALRASIGLSGPDLGFEEEVRILYDAIGKRQGRVDELEASGRQAAEELRILEEGGPTEVTAENIDALLGELPAMGWFKELNEKLVKDQIALLAALRSKTERHPAVQTLMNEVEADKKLMGTIFEEGEILNQYLEKARRLVRSEASRKALAKRIQVRMLSALAACTRDGLEAEKRMLAVLRGSREKYMTVARAIDAKERYRARLEEAGPELDLLAKSSGRVLVPLQAASPGGRVSRNPAQLHLLAMMLAACISGAFIFLRETLDDRLHDAIDLARRLGTVPLIVVPRFRRSAGPAFRQEAIRRADGSAFDAAIRVLLAQGDEVRTILLAGRDAGTGKTTIVAGLARAAARLGKNVAVIDAGRGSILDEEFGSRSRFGLSDLLAGDIHARRRIVRLAAGRAEVNGGWSPEEDPRPHDLEDWRGEGKIFLIPAGPSRPDFPRLLESNAFGALLEELSASHDLVLIDSTPLQSGGEALSIARRVDGTILVARAGQTRTADLIGARRAIDGVGGLILGTILNGVRRWTLSGLRTSRPCPAPRPAARPVPMEA